MQTNTSLTSRQIKEQLLQQKAAVLWLTGLSGAGKSTLAQALEQELQEQGYIVALLDGDVLRNGLNKDLGFTDEDRQENIRRAAETAKILLQNGLVVICSFITPTEKIRQQARQIIGDDYLEVY
ncbi:MAG: adenylyl-sulfate kinase, partial [Hymenobacteraceae bacterium]|nr:adenylyl-sulfate kinase [Hymenobacteraceae bacterium]MDX5397329.1 adenylyl-sulfate kinase [Hymenobacteraceae bacterium]MDX5513408.1 adenylyl-sulfate kinase [Hymenobacteraceae bacterium]